MDPSTTTARDPARCPLCEHPNDCGAARGEATCWCFTAEIPNAVLARIPEADRGVRCVCAGCAAAPSPAGDSRDLADDVH